MASLIDTADLTLNPQEAELVSQAIFEKVYSKPQISNVHGIQTGIQMKTQIPFYGLIGAVGKVSSGCTPNASTEKVNLTEKYWDPALVDFRLTHCQGDVSQLFKMWKRSRIALGTWEEVDNEMMAFITDRGVDAVYEAILRISQFGDTGAKLVANGGYITAGKDIAFLTMINGLWQQVFASTSVKRYTIPENALATKAAQLALASDRALQAMRYLYNEIDSRVFDVAGLKFQMTRSLWNNWSDFLEDKSLAFSLDRTEQGSTKKSYRGIPIEIRNDWDRNIRTWNDLGNTLLYPHRMILTPIDNVPIGTSDEESMSKLDSFYDKVTRSHYLDGAFYIDAKVLEEELCGAAY
jgi:hypothetical protein